MSNFLYQLAIWVPTSIIVWVLIGTSPWLNKGTKWPTSWKVNAAAGALFGLTGGSITFALGETAWDRLVAAVLAAFVAAYIAPRLMARVAGWQSRSRDRSGPGDGA